MEDNVLLEAISKMMDEKMAQSQKATAALMDERLAQAQEATAALVDERLAQAQEATAALMDEKLAVLKKEIARDTVALMDAEFSGKFNLLAEEIQMLRERLPDVEQLNRLQETVDMHHALLRQHSRDIQALKKAN